MSQQQAPWLETAYGWAYGENGWNAGMDSNLLKFSVMFDRNVDSITASLPPAVNGQVHYNISDNRIYFAVNTTYFSTPVPKWFIISVRSTGVTWQFNGSSLNPVESVGSLDSRLDAVEVTLAALGTAAFEDTSAFATTSDLDIVDGQAQSYTDALRGDVADSVSPSKGASLVGYKGRTVSAKLSEVVSVKDFGALSDGVTDDTAAIQAAIDAVESTGGVVAFDSGTSIISSALRVGGGVTLTGKGADVSIIKMSPSFPSNQAAIRNKNISASAYTYDDTGIIIERLQLNGNGNTGRLTGIIDLLKTKNSTVQLCKITNSDYIGITDGGNLNLSILDNELTGLGKTTGVSPTIWSQSYIADGTVSRGTKVTQNYIHNNNRTGLQAASRDMLVSGNYFKNNGESTIFMNSNSLNCKIVNNKIERASRTDISAHGIEVGGGGHLISGNYIYDTDGMGISLTDVSHTVVIGNYIESYRVDTAFYTPAWGCPAIGVTNSPASQTVGLLISSNKVVKGAGSGENAITVYHQAASVACSGVQILNNDLVFGGTGAEIFYQSAITKKLGSNCQVKGNSGHPSRSGVIGSFQAGASIGTFTVTGLPFPPHKIVFDVFHSAVNEVRTSKGVAAKDSTAYTQYTSVNTNTNANTGAVTGSNTVVRIVDSAGVDLFRATITSFEGDDGLSFTIDKSVASINPVIMYDALP